MVLLSSLHVSRTYMAQVSNQAFSTNAEALTSWVYKGLGIDFSQSGATNVRTSVSWRPAQQAQKVGEPKKGTHTPDSSENSRCYRKYISVADFGAHASMTPCEVKRFRAPALRVLFFF